MLKQAIVALVVLHAGDGIARADQVAALNEPEIPSVATISAFHSLAHKKQGLSVRLVEADSIDVAKNPVTLFLIITHDAGGPDSQEHVWRLPAVASVTRVSLSKASVQISARVDGSVNEQTGRLSEHRETLSISYSFAKEQLSDQIRIQTSRP